MYMIWKGENNTWYGPDRGVLHTPLPANWP